MSGGFTSVVFPQCGWSLQPARAGRSGLEITHHLSGLTKFSNSHTITRLALRVDHDNLYVLCSSLCMTLTPKVKVNGSGMRARQTDNKKGLLPNTLSPCQFPFPWRTTCIVHCRLRLNSGPNGKSLRWNTVMKIPSVRCWELSAASRPHIIHKSISCHHKC